MKSRYKLRRNSVIYNCMLRAATEAGRLELVLDLLAQMDAEGVSRDAFTYSGVISACDQLGQWERALQFYDEMVSKCARVPAPPPPATAAAAAAAARSALSRPQPSVVVLNTVLKACVTGRQWRRALELLVQAKRQLGIVPDAISHSLVIAACGLASQHDVAERVFLSFPHYRRDTGMCNAMLTAYERSAHSSPVALWPKALDLLQGMVAGTAHAKPDSRSFATAITVCGRAGEWRQCMALYTLMGTLGIPKDLPVYNAVITALQSAGKWDEARQVLGEGSSTAPSPPLLTAAEIFEASQGVYADGLVEGMFQHWSSPLRGGARASGGPLAPPPTSAHAKEDEVEFNLSRGVDPRTSAPYRYMDLHGFQASVAKTAVSFVFNEMDSTGAEAFDLRIITGRGNHVNSSGERGVLRAEVEAHIRALEPVGLLQVQPVPGNDGCIVVTAESIARWLDARGGGRQKFNS